MIDFTKKLGLYLSAELRYIGDMNTVLRFLWLFAVLSSMLATGPAGAEEGASIVVVCDDSYPPYIFTDEGGRPQGILVEMWKAWEETTGIRVELRPMAWSKAQDSLLKGEADVIDMLFQTPERARLYEFSAAYATLDVPVFIHESLSAITDVPSLRGFTIGVKSGDAVIDVLRASGITDFREYPGYQSLIEAAARGEVRVFSVDAPPATYFLNKMGLTHAFRSAFILYSGEFHRAVRKGNAPLLKKIENGFSAISRSTVEQIHDRWMGTPLLSLVQLRAVRISVVLFSSILGIAILFMLVLRRQVRIKTMALGVVMQQLRESENRYRNVLEHAAEVIFVAQGGLIKYITPSVSRLCGRRPDELLETSGASVIHPDDLPEVMRLHSARMHGDWSRIRSSFRLVTSTGDIRHVSHSSAAIEWEGQPASLNFLLDISDRVQAENELRLSESKLRSLFASMTDVILVYDASGRYVDIAPTRTDLLYRSPQELLGKTLADLFPPDRVDFFLNIIREALASGETVTVDYALSIKEQSHWFTASVTRFSDDAVLWVARDITERKAVESALRKNEERFRFILNDISHVAVQGYDEERRVIFWNEASERLYGYAEAEALGQKLEDLIIPEHMRDAVVTSIRDWVSGGVKIPAEELVLRHKDGHDVPVFSSHVMHAMSSGRREMFCVDLDLAPIRQMQRELMDARDRAEAANLAKSAFLANMSHEIRTPLNGVLAMLALLDATEMGREQREYVRNATLASERLTRLLSDILDLSRIESNKLPIHESAFSLHDVVDSVRDLFALEAGNKGLSLELEMEPDMPDTFVGDEYRLRQVLFNLVGNALKFTYAGWVRVQVAAVQTFGQSMRVLFAVEDTGIGIAPGQLRMIFEPFTQVDRSYVREQQGAGLGLAIVRRLVTLMGGDLYIDSDLGLGSLICFCLPLAQAPHPPILRMSRKGFGTARQLRGLRILLAEDDAINQLAMRTLLEKAGAEVRLAENGAEAVTLAIASAFDVIFMDIQMPEMDGVEATRRIRRAGCSVPVIALTAYAMERDRHEFLEAGMDACLTKPVHLADIAETLDALGVAPHA